MAQIQTFKTAVIGCGAISRMYLNTLCNSFMITEVVGCSDLISEKAKKTAVDFNIKQMSTEEIFGDPEIKITVILTEAPYHYELTKAALTAGKHVYCEKMMAVTLAQGEELYALAKEKKLCYTVAPDTFLGAGLQTARWIIDSGMIGKPIMVNGICQRSYMLDRADDMISMVHREGGGIPFDMGGYYLHAFVNFFGPVEKVTGFAKIVNENRKFLNPHSPLYGDDYTEPCINTISASLEFMSGVLGTLAITSESVSGGPEKIEIIGSTGTLFVHDPNLFSGPVSVKKRDNPEPLIIPYTHAFTEQTYRGIGVADMAYAIKNNRIPRADAKLGLHAFEIIHKIWESASTGLTYSLKNIPERPQAIPCTGLSSQAAEGLFDHS